MELGAKIENVKKIDSFVAKSSIEVKDPLRGICIHTATYMIKIKIVAIIYFITSALILSSFQ